MIRLKTGREINTDSFSLSTYSICDTGFDVLEYDDPPWTEEEKLEIADRMIAMWTGFRDDIKWR